MTNVPGLMRVAAGRILAVLLAFGSVSAALAQATMPDAAHFSDTVRQVNRHVDWLAGLSSRALGTRDHEQASMELRDRLRELAARPGVSLWSHQYEVVVPRTLSAKINIRAGASRGEHRIYPLWPASVRANTTPQEGIEGLLVYIDQGELASLPPRSLAGQIAVMEMTGGNNWQNASNFGARAIVLLGSEGETQRDAHAHLSRLPLNVPRFYVPAGQLCDALREELKVQAEALRRGDELSRGELITARLDCAVEFFSCTAENFYVLVKPEVPSSRAALLLAAPYDAASIVPELAPGADAAVDAATLLAALERYVDRRPSGPVLFAFVDAFANNQAGVREMLLAIAGRERDRTLYVRADQATRQDYARLKLLTDELGGLEPANWSAAINRLGQRGYSSLHRYVKDEVARQVVNIETRLHPLRLMKRNAKDAELQRIVREEERLDELLKNYHAVQNQLLAEGRVSSNLEPLALEVYGSLVKRVEGQWADVNARLWVHRQRRELHEQIMRQLGRDPADWNIQQCQAWAEANGLRGPVGDDLDQWRRWCQERMERDGIDRNAITFMLAIDLSDAGIACGPRLFCSFQSLNEAGNARGFQDWLKRNRATLWSGHVPAVDLTPLENTQALEQYSFGQPANMSSVAPSFGVPAGTWATLNCVRTRVDTPQDRPERLNWQRLAQQIDATMTMLDSLVNDASFAPAPTTPMWSRASGIVVDQSPGEPVPRVPMSGYLVTLVNGYVRGGQQYFYGRAMAEGVRLDEWKFTGTDGMFFFDAMPAVTGEGRANFRLFSVQAYQVDEYGDIVRAVDLNKVGKGVRLDVDIGARNATPRRAVVFSCRQVTALGLFDPRFLLYLRFGTLMDARRAGGAQRMNFALDSGQMCALLESAPDMRWQVLLRAGHTENRMALINVDAPERTEGMAPREMMRGFRLGLPLPVSPMEQAALDFYNLDARRIADYREKGLSSEAIDRVHRQTAELLKKAERARQQNDGQALYANSTRALANELLAYQAVRALANDVVRAAIFLLLALVPFSFAMERLLFASPHVYRQLGGIVGIFTIMTAILWSFHPAFKISSQPLMIIMAFAIIFMSLLVMSIVYQRFKAQLEEMRSGRAESSGARTSRGGLAASAIRLGIANMRKRKLRTALTGITVMLITFALLCFTSVSNYIEASERTLSARSSYTGLLMRQPQQRQMPAASLAVIESAIAGRGQIVTQYWLCSPTRPDWRLRVSTAGPADAGAPWQRRDYAFHAAIGLSGGEKHVSGTDNVLHRWAEFADGAGCYIDCEVGDVMLDIPPDFVPMPAELADDGTDNAEEQRRKREARWLWMRDRQRQWLAAEAQAGRPVRLLVAGQELELLDVYIGAHIGKLTSMTGESIMPINYSSLGPEQRQLLAGQDQDQLTSEIASGAGLEAEEQLPPLAPADVIILPASLVKRLPMSSLRSITVLAASGEQAKTIAHEMASMVSFPIYYGSTGDEVRVLAATALTPQGPKSLAIMLVIAGLIIFNTMLNSIAERKKEIHIYSSLGLAPLHIGVLFLAEAATYGLMGSIFGYIVGQGVATVLAHFQLLGAVTLNYSGTQAIATMMMVVGVTVLSAMVPAYMAGKLAAPSDVMKWAVPKPDNDIIRDTLPFTVTGRTANGVAMFLHDYMDAHREGSIGHFSTDNLKLTRRTVDGREVLGIEAVVWLSPYDLGVRQDVTLTITGTGQSEVLQIDVELRRGAGQVSSWWKLNRTFLGDLRRQLLGWRKLKADRVLEYIAGGDAALAGI